MATAGIILPGGGLQGISQVGNLMELLPALRRNRIDLIYIGGTSVGGLNGAKIGEGQTIDECIEALGTLEKIWTEIQERGPEIIFPLTKIKFAKGLYRGAILDGSILWGLVRGTLLGTSGINPSKILSAPRKFDLVVQNGLSYEQEIFSSEESRFQKNPHEILHAIVAAASLSPFFPAQKVFGIPYKDGRSISALLKRAIQAGCDFIFVLFPYQKGKVDVPTDLFSRTFPGIIEPLLQITVASNDRDAREIEHAKEIAENIRALQKARNNFHTPWGRRMFDKAVEKSGFTFSDKRDLKICDVDIKNKPSSLLIHTFNKKNRDLSQVLESSRKTMKQVLKENGLN